VRPAPLQHRFGNGAAAARIVNEVNGINRAVYDVTSKAVGPIQGMIRRPSQPIAEEREFGAKS
jgi:hypothetical protein